MLIGDVQRAAALMYVSMQRDTRTALASLVSREVYDHLEERELIYRPVGWPLGDYLVTTAGHQELHRLLTGKTTTRRRASDQVRADRQ